MAKAHYGYDAPYVLIGLGVGAVVVTAGAILALVFAGWLAAVWPLLVAIYMVASFLIYLNSTTRGKFAVWEKILDELALRGDERVLDLGCGRGAVLLAAARRLRDGRATGADLWRGVDQSGNALAVTRANAELGVADAAPRSVGWRMWWGGPWLPSRLVTGTKP